MNQIDRQRALLDSLMGKGRDMTECERKEVRTRHWFDSDVCNFYLCGFCPFDLFTNTRSDLGFCEKDHDDKLRETFQAEPARRRYNVETIFLRELERLLTKADIKIRRAEERVKLQFEPDQDPKTESKEERHDREEKIAELNENIKALQKQMETLGEEGKVDESATLLTLVNNLKEAKAELESPSVGNDMQLISQVEKRMEVCKVCASFLVVDDIDIRVQAHLNGKQHVGYAKIREMVETMEGQRFKEGVPERVEPIPREDKGDRVDRGDRRGRDRRRDRSRRRDSGRRRDRDRRRRSRSRSRSRDRSRNTHSRSRSKNRRDRK